MKKISHQRRSLELNRETITRLTDDLLKHAAGGRPAIALITGISACFPCKPTA